MSTGRVLLFPDIFPPGHFLKETEATILRAKIWMNRYAASQLTPLKITVINAVIDYAERRFCKSTIMNIWTCTQRKLVCQTILEAFRKTDADFVDTVARACASIKDSNSELRDMLITVLNHLPAPTFMPAIPSMDWVAPTQRTPRLPIAKPATSLNRHHFFNTRTGRALLFGSAMGTIAFCNSLQEGNFFSAPAKAVATVMVNTTLAVIVTRDHLLKTTGAITGVTTLFYLLERGLSYSVMSEGLIAGGMSLLAHLPYRQKK